MEQPLTAAAIQVDGDSCLKCASLGAMLVFSGLENCAKIVHGGPGCAGQIRRTLIRHFRQPVEIDTSAVSDASAIHGGEKYLRTAITRAMETEKSPSVIGICTTCLTETIGDDVGAILARASEITGSAQLVWRSAPSYKDGYREGFHNAVKSIIERLSGSNDASQKGGVNILPGIVSPADLRFLKRTLDNFRLDYTLLPDYSKTLDGQIGSEIGAFPKGGATRAKIELVPFRAATIEFSPPPHSPGKLIEKLYGVPNYPLETPIGIEDTDRFYALLEKLSGKPMGEDIDAQRGRLIASYLDSSSMTMGRRIGIQAGSDFEQSLSKFVKEIGAQPVIVSDEQTALPLELIIGDSSIHKIADALSIPLIRVGFPIFDRIGGSRRLHLGYEGAQRLFDEIANSR